MLIRVLACARDNRTRTRLQELLLRQSDMIVETLELAGTPLWDRLLESAVDLALIDRTAIPGPESGSVARLSAIESAPGIVVFGLKPSSRTEARLLAAGCLAVLDLSLGDGLLSQALEGVLERVRRERSDDRRMERQVNTPDLADFVTHSAAMRAFMSLVERVVHSDSTLLIGGKTGVGKEHLARAIHAAGPRGKGPFVAVNCGALPETLLESELFGHTRGAFTGATATRRGWFELAHRGTVFLDEIAEMPLHLQSRLLRVLQDRRVAPVGSERSIPIDVRVMSATNRDLAAEVTAHRFREDLFYRLSVVTLEVPPLRARCEDIPELVGRYVDHYRSRMATRVREFSGDALRAMQSYPWPGNIRELVNVVERSMLLCNRPVVQARDLPREISEPEIAGSATTAGYDPLSRPASDIEFVSRPFRAARGEVLRTFERDYLTALLRVSGGRVGEAAKRSGMSTRNLFDKLRKYGLDRKDFKY